MTNLQSYLEERRMSVRDLVERINAAPGLVRESYSLSGVRKAVTGERPPTHAMIVAVYVATDGEFEPNHWFDLDRLRGLNSDDDREAA